MPDPVFPSFNFLVEIRLPGSAAPLCGAGFQECDGLEMNHEVKTIRQGGDNGRQIRLTGPVGFGTLTLKRGMTSSPPQTPGTSRPPDLWSWFAGYMTVAGQRKRAETEVILRSADRQQVLATFKLSRCVPVKIKAPALHARDGILAIEELQLAYESLEYVPGRGP